jgi:hypothetical protein
MKSKEVSALLFCYLAFIIMPCLLMAVGFILALAGYGIGGYLFAGSPLLCLIGIFVVEPIERGYQ